MIWQRMKGDVGRENGDFSRKERKIRKFMFGNFLLNHCAYLNVMCWEENEKTIESLKSENGL